MTRLLALITQYKDCFAWDYLEMSGLSMDLVEHRLPLKDFFKPYKHPSKCFNLEVMLMVKKEVEHLMSSRFIRMTKYAD